MFQFGGMSESTLAATTASDVARGVARLFARNDIWCLTEMPLRNGRRADMMGIDAKGQVIIVEIKVQRGDLLGSAPGDGSQPARRRRISPRLLRHRRGRWL